MDKPLFINKEAFQKARKKGLHKLHVQLLLLFFFLVLFFIIGFLTMHTLFEDQQILVQYCVQVGIEMLLWLIAIIFLWQETKVGRLLFAFFSVLSLYAMYSFVVFYRYDAKDIYEELIRILFTVLFICKSITLIVSSLRLFQRPISYIWERFDSTGKEAEEHDQALIQKLFIENDTYELYKQSDRKITRRALQNLRKSTIFLIGCVYGFLLLFYIGLFVLRLYVSSDGIGIDYVQRYILMASLYSAFIWSLPAIGMFLFKQWTYYTFLLAWILEITRFATSLSETIDSFMTQHYGIPSIIAICLIELLRYVILARFTIAFIKDPFIQAYWKKQKQVKS